MSSDSVQSLLAQQRLDNYGSLVIVIAICYDYCLTFSKEVTYVWVRDRHLASEHDVYDTCDRKDPGRGFLRCFFLFVMSAFFPPSLQTLAVLLSYRAR
ncbi:hypothetical protein L210DRAFT_2056794 [Boletus edulis BED1]|uniref:DUF6533 domain-containing protein n=1 Tax=Boletus edulis BED1 TaxID=1328754 RepID=A0AAD4C9N1_BOLED|nr:hypothetical protein L210DRAFT_2056794 [Boletus edulis BED1]